MQTPISLSAFQFGSSRNPAWLPSAQGVPPTETGASGKSVQFWPPPSVFHLVRVLNRDSSELAGPSPRTLARQIEPTAVSIIGIEGAGLVDVGHLPAPGLCLTEELEGQRVLPEVGSPTNSVLRPLGRPRFYPNRMFLKALVIMMVRHLHKVHEPLSVLEQPTAEMQTLRSLLTERGHHPSRRTWERQLKGLTPTMVKRYVAFSTSSPHRH